ncbi:hypothetical protein [Mycolicibacterium gilvum]|uniref:hypothetical protein n=1 Tax=Mycolicibacterium gilvum TaxID=1804 RepID=UPI0040456102
MTTTETIQLPADAIHVGDWDDPDGSGEWSRHFTGTRHSETVAVIGLQHAAGKVERCVGVHVDDVLTPTAARELAGALLAAAMEADQLDASQQ